MEGYESQTSRDYSYVQVPVRTVPVYCNSTDSTSSTRTVRTYRYVQVQYLYCTSVLSTGGTSKLCVPTLCAAKGGF